MLEPDQTDWKTIGAVIAGIVGVVAPLMEALSTVSDRESLASRAQKERQRASDTIDLLAKLETEHPERHASARTKLLEDLDLTLEDLAKTVDDRRELRKDPNYSLTLWQRLFVLFPPQTRRSRLVHTLTHLFMIALTLFTLGGIGSRIGFHAHPLTADTRADSIIFLCFGVLVFRGWALAERRWTFKGYQPVARLRDRVFALGFPASKSMLVAQICFWTCCFWVVEAVKDALPDEDDPTKALLSGENILKLCAPLAAAALCSLWTALELKFAKAKPAQPLRFLALRPHPVAWSSAVIFCVAAAVYSAILVMPVLGDDPSHRAAFLAQAAVFCTAFVQCLTLSLALRTPSKQTQTMIARAV